MSKTKIRNHELEDIIERILFFYNSQKKFSNIDYSYIILNQNILSFQQLIKSPKNLFKLILTVTRLHKKFYLFRVIKLPFKCDSIRVKNNIRIFGYDGDKSITVKIALKGDFREGNLKREIKAKNILTNRYHSKIILKTIEYDLEHWQWFMEQQIKVYKSIQKYTLAKLFIQNHAFDFYSQSVIYKSASNIFDELQEFNIDCSNKIIPLALCHGDMSTGNMLISSEGEFFLIDLEKSKYCYIVDDLIKFYVGNDNLRDDIINLLDKFSTRPNVIPPKIQIALALLNKVRETNINYHQIFSYYEQALRIEKAFIDQKIQQRIENYIRLANELLNNN